MKRLKNNFQGFQAGTACAVSNSIERLGADSLHPFRQQIDSDAVGFQIIPQNNFQLELAYFFIRPLTKYSTQSRINLL